MIEEQRLKSKTLDYYDRMSHSYPDNPDEADSWARGAMNTRKFMLAYNLIESDKCITPHSLLGGNHQEFSRIFPSQDHSIIWRREHSRVPCVVTYHPYKTAWRENDLEAFAVHWGLNYEVNTEDRHYNPDRTVFVAWFVKGLDWRNESLSVEVAREMREAHKKNNPDSWASYY